MFSRLSTWTRSRRFGSTETREPSPGAGLRCAHSRGEAQASGGRRRAAPPPSCAEPTTDGCRRPCPAEDADEFPSGDTLARASSGLRIRFTTMPLASGSLLKLERKSSKVVQTGEPILVFDRFRDSEARGRDGRGPDSGLTQRTIRSERDSPSRDTMVAVAETSARRGRNRIYLTGTYDHQPPTVSAHRSRMLTQTSAILHGGRSGWGPVSNLLYCSSSPGMLFACWACQPTHPRKRS